MKKFFTQENVSYSKGFPAQQKLTHA